MDDETLHKFNWDETYGTENTIRIFLTKFEFANAKLEELEKWKSNHMYEVVSNEGQDCISLRWTNATKFDNDKLKTESWLVDKGFQEKHDFPYKDSSPCKKECWV